MLNSKMCRWGTCRDFRSSLFLPVGRSPSRRLTMMVKTASKAKFGDSQGATAWIGDGNVKPICKLCNAVFICFHSEHMWTSSTTLKQSIIIHTPQAPSVLSFARSHAIWMSFDSYLLKLSCASSGHIPDCLRADGECMQTLSDCHIPRRMLVGTCFLLCYLDWISLYKK